ncbi:deoxyribodipyrimidine photo-lyase [Aureitalea sp. L0-47]|uniref:cryptochrome/photolyase family protein n=1 Tax=Aureitalea sp. L0-47 TaxID=2816962 RepID=UPI0022380057|nr:deoxyribodipyrimidine photo-lyase [Aureitalea sp. L0-47]MCW5520467.1 deoxyribodipyrimidine photo-lyase [Aureitalea sp. L0-47]
MQEVNVFWFRRDLRLDDNVGFFKALQGKHPVLLLFIFDKNILDELPADDARVSFIFKHVQRMRDALQEEGSSIATYFGEPIPVFEELIKDYDVQNVITNHDYEPYAKDRDNAVKEFLSEKQIGFYSYKDQVIFEKDEVVKDDGDPYVVYTPYMKTWRSNFDPDKHLKDHNPSKHLKNLYQHSRLPNLSLSDMGFEKSSIEVPDYDVSSSLIDNYEKTRNFPDRDGTSHLGPHLRFGTVSIRQMVRRALDSSNDVFLKELIWREFFMQILYHFPHTVNKAFKAKYDRIPWRNKEEEFERWKEGKTGYPLVDAGMRQLNATGYMHNRVRMLVASFLCKHLLIDWRWGEAYFAEKLLDYEQASNVGNWQWAAGSGVDAAPYFRIFNPITQVDKFDKDKKYIKTWVKEFGTTAYCDQIVEHKKGRERALHTYKEALM